MSRDVVPTTREALRRRFRSIRGRTVVACEAGPFAAWVAALLTTRLRSVIVCDPRQNRLLAAGSKTDRVDADKLSELLRLDAVRPVYVGDRQHRELRALAKHDLTLQTDRRRVVQRLHGLFRQLRVPFHAVPRRPDRLPIRRLPNDSSRFVARSLLSQLHHLTALSAAAREEFLSKARQFSAFYLLQSIPYVGQVRAAHLVAIVGVPQRFPSLRQFWAYAGLSVVRRVSAEHRVENGRPVREQVARGLHLNTNRHVRLKKIFKDIALFASLRAGLFRTIFDRHVARGKSHAIARVALARKVAAIVRAVWRSGESFNAAHIQLR